MTYGYVAAAAPFVSLLLYQAYTSLRDRNAKVLKISEIYVYPIKSLRPTKPSQALATRYGFEYDRRFMLLQVTPEGYKNMAVSNYPDMTQFLTDITFDEKGNGTIAITFQAFGTKDSSRELQIPLLPNTEKLEPFNVDMHGSPTQAFKMPDEHNAWFSECFGYEVVIVYLGKYTRQSLFQDLKPSNRSAWLSPITSSIPLLKSLAPQDHPITFADCAPYLIVSSTSLADVSSRLPPGEEMDVTKFRPNLVVEGADAPWEEDYWNHIRIGSADILMKHNCVRCKSINVDYATGKPGKGESGEVLKKLQKDRRIDIGSKWSPVFGRYSFWNQNSPDQIFKVGDEVRVLEVNKNRTVWNWPGLS